MSAADAAAAVRIGVAELVQDVRTTAQALAPEWRARVAKTAELAEQLAVEVETGVMSGEAAAQNLRRLSDGLQSDLISAGYQVKAERLAIAGKALGLLFKVAAAAIAA